MVKLGMPNTLHNCMLAAPLVPRSSQMLGFALHFAYTEDVIRNEKAKIKLIDGCKTAKTVTKRLGELATG